MGFNSAFKGLMLPRWLYYLITFNFVDVETIRNGTATTFLVLALRYKPEGRGFDPR